MESITDDFADATIVLDGRRFVNCSFRNCVLVFNGTEQFALVESCTYDSRCRVFLGKDSARVYSGLKLLHSLALMTVELPDYGSGLAARLKPGGGVVC